MKTRLQQRGFGLIELMVALTLGLLIIGGAVGIFMGTRQTSRTTDDLSRLQEAARFAFELMSRELREAGNTPCGSWVTVQSMSSPEWWATWAGTQGYGDTTAFPGAAFGTTAGSRVAGTDAVALWSAQGFPEERLQQQADGSVELKLTNGSSQLKAGDIALACDVKQALMFKVVSAGSTIDTGGTGQSVVRKDGLLTRMSASAWYVGNTGRSATGGRALFRATPAGAQEVIDGVRDLQMAFRTGATYQDAAAVTDWGEVNAVRITLTFQSPERNTATNTAASGVADSRLTRTFTHTVALRNMLQ